MLCIFSALACEASFATAIAALGCLSAKLKPFAKGFMMYRASPAAIMESYSTKKPKTFDSKSSILLSF